MTNSGEVMIKALTLLVSLTVALVASAVALAAEKDAGKDTTFEVPTSGRILDVSYMPEFDEWWVKCQDKDGISVYTYDRRSKQWHRARFIAAPPTSEDKTKEGERSTVVQDKSAKPKEPARAEKGSAKSPQSDPPSEAGTGKREGETTKEPGKKGDTAKNWWDPRNILKLDSSKSPQK